MAQCKAISHVTHTPCCASFDVCPITCVCLSVCVHVTNVFGSQFLFGNVACEQRLLLFPSLPFTGFSFLSSQSPFVTRQFPRYFPSYIISPTDTQIYNLTHNQQQLQQQQGQRQPRHMRFSRFSRFPRRMAASFPLSMSRHKTEVSSRFFQLTAAGCLLLVACISGKSTRGVRGHCCSNPNWLSDKWHVLATVGQQRGLCNKFA